MAKKGTNQILIITDNPFPIGLAGTNRILSYCKGFLFHGFQPNIICFRPTETFTNIFNTSIEGVYNNINYCYPGKITTRVSSFWGRRKNDLIAEYKTLSLLFKTLKRREVSFIIIYGNCITIEFLSILLAKIFKTGIYKENSEHPEIYFRGKKHIFNSLKKWFLINKKFSYYTGVLVMTHPLKAYFISKRISERKILIVPQTVDHERFEAQKNETIVSFPNEYVGYVGSLNQEKDGILTLVNSFSEVIRTFPEMRLLIAGEGTKNEKEKLLKLIDQLQLKESVNYLGRISSTEVPSFYNKAKLLVSCRPQSIQSDFGFPTKIIEYMSSGKPVVTTATGELGFYLKDRINVFVAANSDANTFALKINEALQNYPFAIKVAQKAKEFVSDKFNPIQQTKTIIEFCKG